MGGWVGSVVLQGPNRLGVSPNLVFLIPLPWYGTGLVEYLLLIWEEHGHMVGKLHIL